VSSAAWYLNQAIVREREQDEQARDLIPGGDGDKQTSAWSLNKANKALYGKKPSRHI